MVCHNLKLHSHMSEVKHLFICLEDFCVSFSLNYHLYSIFLHLLVSLLFSINCFVGVLYNIHWSFLIWVSWCVSNQFVQSLIYVSPWQGPSFSLAWGLVCWLVFSLSSHPQGWVLSLQLILFYFLIDLKANITYHFKSYYFFKKRKKRKDS